MTQLETPGEIIKQYISLWGTNQKEIAKEVGISPQHLSDIIQHKRNPSPSVAYDIFDALCMSASSQKKCIEFWLKDLLRDWRIGVIVMKPSIAFVPRPGKQATKEQV